MCSPRGGSSPRRGEDPGRPALPMRTRAAPYLDCHDHAVEHLGAAACQQRGVRVTNGGDAMRDQSREAEHKHRKSDNQRWLICRRAASAWGLCPCGSQPHRRGGGPSRTTRARLAVVALQLLPHGVRNGREKRPGGSKRHGGREDEVARRQRGGGGLLAERSRWRSGGEEQEAKWRRRCGGGREEVRPQLDLDGGSGRKREAPNLS